MFTRCIHCCSDLGTNEILEHFPVGHKLAFDSERGRLWVICPHCARWNLTPLEERWETVEDCERLFRNERLRAQTPNIGYALGRDSTGLVRIGRPLRPEFAAWRYGREFSRRHERRITMVAAAGFATAGVLLGSAYVGAGMIVPQLAVIGFNVARSFFRVPTDVELPRGPGRAWTVSGDGTMLLPDPATGWYLTVRHHFGHVEYRGADARRMLASLLTRWNRTGGHDALVRAAVAEVQERPGDDLFRSVAQTSEGLWSLDEPKQREYDNNEWMAHQPRPLNRAGISRLPPVRRLALEMALHEHTEQRALEGELSELESAWREAEEIAGIADNLLVPPHAEEFIRKHSPSSSDGQHK